MDHLLIPSRTYKEKLILYYSDQRDNATHSQKLVHQTTTDLKKWSSVIEDTKYDDYYARPGMPTVAKLPNNEYIYTYEYGGGPNPPAGSTYWFPVFYRLSKDPQKFLNKPGQQIISTDGTRPAGSPYVVWTPYGGKNGTIVVSCGTMSEIFTNVTSYEYAYSKAPENMKSLVMSVNLFMSAISAAIGQAFTPLSDDPYLVWNYTAVAIIAFAGGVAFWFCFHHLDGEEDRLNMLKKTKFVGKNQPTATTATKEVDA